MQRCRGRRGAETQKNKIAEGQRRRGAEAQTAQRGRGAEAQRRRGRKGRRGAVVQREGLGFRQ